MRLQEVLREREAEITALEQSLEEGQKKDRPVAHPIIVNGVDGKIVHVEDVAGVTNGELSDALTPKTLDRFENIRKTMENGHADTVSSQDEDESLERLNELMLYGDSHLALRESDTLLIGLWRKRNPSTKKL